MISLIKWKFLLWWNSLFYKDDEKPDFIYEQEDDD